MEGAITILVVMVLIGLVVYSNISPAPREPTKTSVAVATILGIFAIAGIIAASLSNSFWPAAILGALIGGIAYAVGGIIATRTLDGEGASGIAVLSAIGAGVLSLLFSSFTLTELAWLPLLAVVVGLVVWAVRSRDGLTGAERRELNDLIHAERIRKQDLIREGLIETEFGHKCPLCGGTQFKARRTARQRAAITAGTITTGIGGIMSAQKRGQKIQCITCGTFFDRIKV